MAFVAENGTGLANANSLTTREEADTYHADRGNTSWAAASTGNRELALIKATDYVEQRFQLRFIGRRVVEDQSLSFPRKELVDRQGRLFAEDVVPRGVKYAVFEYALRALTAPLLSDPSATGGAIKRKLERVGSLEEETEYVDGASASILPKYPTADLMLAPFLRSSSAVMR